MCIRMEIRVTHQQKQLVFFQPTRLLIFLISDVLNLVCLFVFFSLSFFFKYHNASPCLDILNSILALMVFHKSEHKPGRLCVCSAAPARGIHRLCVLGQGLHGNPLGAGSGGGCTVSSKLLLLGGHAPPAPVPRGGHHKRSRRPAQVQVSASFGFRHLNWLAWYCREKIYAGAHCSC